MFIITGTLPLLRRRLLDGLHLTPQHKSVLTWVKPRFRLGAYFRGSTEHVIFGLRGRLRLRSTSIATHFEAPVGAHSEKPEKFYEIVREASYLPAGEAFQRKARDGFINLFAETEAQRSPEVGVLMEGAVSVVRGIEAAKVGADG